MARGGDGTPEEPRNVRAGRGRHSIANQRRLQELGEVVDERQGVRRHARKVRPHRLRRRVIISTLVLVIVVGGVVGGSYLYANYRFDEIPKIKVVGEQHKIPGQPFNILMIGSDSRAGLSGLTARQSGATTGSVAGQRSDVVKIVHVDPNAGTIAMVSIPRDTMVTLLQNQSLYGQFNRINVNFGNGPSLLAQTITANFGIPIQDTIVVSFAGLINAADALGGVYLRFPYTSRDPYSGLNIKHPGCQLIEGFPALAVARSRHFYYNTKGEDVLPSDYANLSYDELASLGWYYDPTSDFGRIDRQDAFLRAMIDRAKTLYNPLTINSFLSKIPQGITLDQNFSLNELIGLAVKFHSINANSIVTYTLPTYPSTSAELGDVLFVEQPEAQEQLVSVFGSGLEQPTNPPPTESLSTPPPPVVTTTTAPTTSTTPTKSTSSATPTSAPTTTTTNPTLQLYPWDPTPCSP